jgi:hydroxylamine reductase (hybrid-cluster protein)
MALALFGAHEKLLALVDVLIELVAVARLRRVEKIAQCDLPIEEFSHPVR